MKQTSHGKQRIQDPDRPSAYARQDRLQPKEMYIDNETSYLIYVGSNGRTHIFTDDDKYHTSFITTRRHRILRASTGKWTRQFKGD